MRKSVCILFFKNYIREISRGQGEREHVNPAKQFVKNEKAGLHNLMSDEDYHIRHRIAEELATFWEEQPMRTTLDVLQSAIKNIDIDSDSLQKIAEILTECYFSTAESKAVEEEIKELDFLEESEEFDLEGTIFDTMQETQGSMSSQKCADENSQNDAMNFTSPQEIYECLSKHVYGQEEAVKAAAMLLYNHKQGRKRNVLFMGPTGCGKTEIWRVCRQIYPHIRIVDSTAITGEGWTGSFKLSNIFDSMSKQEAEKLIVVFDEFDKLCEPQIGSHGTNYSMIVQNELLKLIEGTEVDLKNFLVDTSKISFVFCGSFEQLTKKKTEGESGQSIGFGANLEKREAHHTYRDIVKSSDLVKYASVRQEIVGRINQIVQLSPMTAGGYLKILKDEQMSPLHQLERQYGIKLCLDEDTMQRLVREAEETHMGVRYLRSRIQEMLDEQMFRDCNRTEYKLVA